MAEAAERPSEQTARPGGVLVEALPAEAVSGQGPSKDTDDAKGDVEKGDDSKGEKKSRQEDDSKAPKDDEKPRPPWVKYVVIAVTVIGLLVSLPFLIPWIVTVLNTVSTDDAYVNGHVTFVAPRVGGQVSRVLVDDNMRVKKGDLLVRLDQEPFRIQLLTKEAALAAAEADLTAAKAQVRGLIGLGRSQRWQLQSARDQVANQVANLRAAAATYESRKASLALAEANFERGRRLLPSGGLSKEDFDERRQQVKVNESAVKQALEMVYATRASLGLSPKPAPGRELTDVPPDLAQNFSGVRSALSTLVQTMAQIGLPLARSDATPEEVLDEFRRQDSSGGSDRTVEPLIANSPAVKQAAAKLLQARRDLEQAQLNLSYCDVVSDIDGVVTRRNVNPGNYVDVGQSLMAVRSIREIWIDANFKEGQLADLRIGQPVRCEVDMYGSRREFKARISGFTMGTGQTLSLLPPQNATGNFVKIVQRLPVRLELTDYDPDRRPLFVGLSVVAYVYFKETPEGANAGAVLQPYAPLPQPGTESKSAGQ